MDGFVVQGSPGRNGDRCLANNMDTAEEGKYRTASLVVSRPGLTSVSFVSASRRPKPPAAAAAAAAAELAC